MRLLERDDALSEGETAFEQAEAGLGRILLVSGEAGIGKSSFVLALHDRFAARSRFLTGGCDDLSTPRPYAPFLDLARQGLDQLAQALVGGDLSAVLDGLLDDLAGETAPVVLAIEDIHWSDNASLDALTALARRIGGLPIILVLTYRDLPRGHPAVSLVGRLPHALASRIELRPLTVDAVSEMAGEPIGPDHLLYASTRGNPFFVTELLAAREEGVPATVADAVLARMASLPDATRDLLELLSVIPNRVPIELLDRLSPAWLDHIETAEERGIVEIGPTVQFRHALIRRAVEASLSATQRRRTGQTVLASLLETDGPLTQIVHHAQRIGATEVLAEFAPRAAREATNAAAHREAIRHLRLALDNRGHRPDGDQASLHDALSRQLWFDGRQDEAMEHVLQAIALLEQGDPADLGAVLRSAANLCEWRGDSEGHQGMQQRALTVLEPLGPSPNLAMLASDIGFRLTIDVRIEQAQNRCDQGVRIAEQTKDPEALAVCCSTAAYLANWAHGRTDIWDRVLGMNGPEVLEATVVAHYNRAFIAIERADDEAAREHLRHGVDFMQEHQATAALGFARLAEARLAMKQGAWSVADGSLARARELVDIDSIGPAFAVEHDYCAGRLATRRGDGNAALLLDRAWNTAAPLDQMARRLAPAVAFAELAALDGRKTDAVVRLQSCDRIHDDPDLPWAAEVAYWLWRADAFDRPIPESHHPRYLSMRGEWEAAAAAWAALGRPYEHAEALTRCDELATRLEGLALLDELDAGPLAAATRQALRAGSVRNIPRGPTQTTRGNPAGLTARQLDVLRLLGGGNTNDEIAEQLFVSVRTVDSHVGAILQKLSVGSRREAARRADELGIT